MQSRARWRRGVAARGALQAIGAGVAALSALGLLVSCQSESGGGGSIKPTTGELQSVYEDEPGVAANPAPGGPSTEQQLTSEQLRERIRAFADRYRNVMAEAADEIMRKRTDPLLRQKAHQFKIDGATAMYDIAVDPSPQQALLNTLVLVTLQAQLAQAHAVAEFPEDHPLIQQKTQVVKDDAWNLAASVMSEQQRRELLQVIERWWADNTDVREIWYVRIADFAGYGKGTALEGLVGGVTGLPGSILNAFVPVRDASQSLDKATMLAERASWLAPRLLILAQWRAEAIVLESLATTEVKSMLDTAERATSVADRATSVAEQLPEEVSRQARSLLDGVAENEEPIANVLSQTRQTVESVQGVTADVQQITEGASELMSATDQTVAGLEELTRAVDDLMARMERMQNQPKDKEGEPFDITEYTAAIHAANNALQETNALVDNLHRSTRPEVLESRLNVMADTGVGFAESLTDDLARLIIIAGVTVTLAGLIIVAAAKLIPTRVRTTLRA